MKEIIKKWYFLLNFPKEFDESFFEILNKKEINPIKIKDYVPNNDDYEYNLLIFLYMCEELSLKYKENNIDDKILIDTMEDIVRWTITHYTMHEKLGLSEVLWLKRHINFKLFKLGRLQFCMEDELTVHIPSGEDLKREKCIHSFNLAIEFFNKYFKDYKYTKFVCNSWLLDDNLNKLLSENTNIIKFGKMFTKSKTEPCDVAIRFILRWDMTKEKLKDFITPKGFPSRLKEYVLNGGELCVVEGYILKEDVQNGVV